MWRTHISHSVTDPHVRGNNVIHCVADPKVRETKATNSPLSYGKKAADPPERVADVHVRGNNVIHCVVDPQVREM